MSQSRKQQRKQERMLKKQQIRLNKLARKQGQMNESSSDNSSDFDDEPLIGVNTNFQFLPNGIVKVSPNQDVNTQQIQFLNFIQQVFSN